MNRFAERCRGCALLIMVIVFTLIVPSAVSAKTLWVVLLPHTSLSEWRSADAPHLHQVLDQGAVGLMNTRTAAPSNASDELHLDASLLTLGAGSRATAPGQSIQFALPESDVPMLSVTARQLYIRRMAAAPAAGSDLCLQWPNVLHVNAQVGYDLHVGNLADTLGRAGIVVEAVGGEAADVAASDSLGTVHALPTLPSAVSTSDQCIFVDAGPSLLLADHVIGSLMTRIGDGELIVLSPLPDRAAEQAGITLCPVAVWSAGCKPGLLVSESTRRPGLVTNTDFAPSAAAYFGISRSTFPVLPFGYNWTVKPTQSSMARLAHLQQAAMLQWRGMHILPYLAIVLGCWMAIGTVLRSRIPLPGFAASVPPALVAAALLSVSPATFIVWASLGVLCAIFAPRGVYYGLIMAVLIVDMLIGDPLMSRSLLGYSAIEGARYYGIGNESMGALMGASLIVFDMVYGRCQEQYRWGVVIGMALISALLVMPEFGAKAGGLVVALVGYGSYLWLRSGRRMTPLGAILSLVSILCLLLLIAFLDSRLGGAHVSHIGQAVRRFHTGGPMEWIQIIQRKLQTEGHLVFRSAWSVSLWAGGIALLVLRSAVQQNDKPLYCSGLLLILACLVFNDAGTVAASLCIALLWSRWAGQKIARQPQVEVTGCA